MSLTAISAAVFATGLVITIATYKGVRALMLSHRRIWVIGYLPSPSLPARTLRQESLVLNDDFTQVAAHSYKGIWLTLWIRRE